MAQQRKRIHRIQQQWIWQRQSTNTNWLRQCVQSIRIHTNQKKDKKYRTPDMARIQRKRQRSMLQMWTDRSHHMARDCRIRVYDVAEAFGQQSSKARTNNNTTMRSSTTNNGMTHTTNNGMNKRHGSMSSSGFQSSRHKSTHNNKHQPCNRRRQFLQLRLKNCL